MSQKILLKRSSVVDASGNPKLPDASSMDYGEIAVNYAAGAETLSIKNSSNEIVTFSSDNSSGGGSVNTNIDNDDEIYYIKLSNIATDSACMITESPNIKSRQVIEDIRNNSHRYLGKYIQSADTMYLCQLDDDNSELFANDGSSADLTGTHGDVFMKLPRFYYRSLYDGNGWKIYFSFKKPSDKWKCWYGNDLIGAFKSTGYVGDNTDIFYASSVKSSKRAMSAATYNNSVSKVLYRFEGVSHKKHGKSVTWKQHCMMAILFYAYYLDTYFIKICGSGETSHCGSQLSMIDTTSSNGNSTNGTNFWGLEDWCSSIYEWIYDFNYNDSSKYLEETTYDEITGDDLSKRILCSPVGKCENISKLYIGENLDITPYDLTSAITPCGYCSYYDSAGNELFRGGQGYEQSSLAALRTISHYNQETYRGFRISYVGPWEEIKSPTDFKAIRGFKNT